MKNPAKLRLPLIGITLVHEAGGGYSKLPWYALRENYCSAVSAHNALPLPLPHDAEQAEYYLDLIDGLILTGGAFDVPPDLYGEASKHASVTTKDGRTKFEYAMVKGALAQKMPILGICGGEQLLNVALGGTLIQHIPDAINGAFEHEQKNPRHEPGHEVAIEKNTLLHKIIFSSPLARERMSASLTDAARIVGGSSGVSQSPHPNLPPQGGKESTIAVNSAHHQAVAKPAPGIIVNATSSDGVIEGIEYPAHPFCLGVQWHPEYNVSPADKKIFEAFIQACR